jgi:hypothetical protein
MKSPIKKNEWREFDKSNKEHATRWINNIKHKMKIEQKAWVSVELE